MSTLVLTQLMVELSARFHSSGSHASTSPPQIAASAAPQYRFVGCPSTRHSTIALSIYKNLKLGRRQRIVLPTEPRIGLISISNTSTDLSKHGDGKAFQIYRIVLILCEKYFCTTGGRTETSERHNTPFSSTFAELNGGRTQQTNHDEGGLHQHGPRVGVLGHQNV